MAKKIITENMNHIVITDEENNLKGIVTSFDVTKAIAEEKTDLKKKDVKAVVEALTELALKEVKKSGNFLSKVLVN